jgi:hypothetical protein
MKFQVSDPSQTANLAATYLLIAYEACGAETGMGFLQAVRGLNELTILDQVHNYPTYANDGFIELRGDYIAGRMVKTNISYNPADGIVVVSDGIPTPDYQGWSSGIPRDPGVLRFWVPTPNKFDSYRELLLAAADRIGVEVKEL